MDKQLQSFREKGYVLLRGLLTPFEVERLKESTENVRDLLQQCEIFRKDGYGRINRMYQWKGLPDNTLTAIATSEKVVNTVEKVLEGEVYYYHSKFIMKDARTGGSLTWHQDYGYWHELKVLYPTLGTLLIAVDKADKTNGCLQILDGSHLVGRMNCCRIGDQIGADPERVEILMKHLPLRYVELEPGDAIFFHSNLLHKSAQNSSDKRRWAFLVCYNRVDNIPYGDHPHADYKYLEKVPDSAILTSPLTAEADKWEFYDYIDANSLS